MATYNSNHTGQQVDEAVDIVLANKSKGDSSTPIYLDPNGVAITITKSLTPTSGDNKLITSGAVYTGLSSKYAIADISTDTSLGNSDTVISSQGAVKTYVDTLAATKQDTIIAGEGISIENNEISLSPTSDMLTIGDLDNKWEHFGNLAVGNGVDELSKISEAAHSTFDRSKFTVVGSPTITDDGIASGFSDSNYIDPILFDYDTSKTTVIDFEGIASDVTTAQRLYSFYDSNTQTINININCVFIQDNTIRLLYKDSSQIVANVNISSGDKIRVKASFSDSKRYLYVKNLTTNIENEIEDNTLKTTSYIGLGLTLGWLDGYWSGAHHRQNVFLGSIDLKQFSITVDGVPVFSGNRTGIDVLKTNGFTTVGTPVISDDGILTATTTNQNNYVLSSSITGSDVDKIILRFKGANKPTSSVTLNSGVVYSVAYTDGSIGFFITTTDGNKNLSFGVPSSLWGEWVDLLWEKTPGGYRAGYKLATGSTYTYSNEYTTSYSLSTGQMSLGRFTDGVSSAGQFDLNCCKVYSATGLIWQGCLRIPYVITKDGKKIADSFYRDRVIDEYTQAGYTPYYTLQVGNISNYTMATNKLQDIVETYQNGVNKCIKRANLQLEEYGTCTETTPVTFTEPFRDNQYALTVPYSVKSATGFTPALGTGETRDWIAKGFYSL